MLLLFGYHLVLLRFLKIIANCIESSVNKYPFLYFYINLYSQQSGIVEFDEASIPVLFRVSFDSSGPAKSPKLHTNEAALRRMM